jgi:hypothetical protein
MNPEFNEPLPPVEFVITYRGTVLLRTASADECCTWVDSHQGRFELDVYCPTIPTIGVVHLDPNRRLVS